MRFYLIALLAIGCIRPTKVDIQGTYAGEPAGTLAITGDTFRLEHAGDVLEGETSRQGERLWLHTKKLNGLNEEAFTIQAIKDAQTMGVARDMEIVGSIWTTFELTVSEDGKSLTMTLQKPLRGGKQPYANQFRAFRRS